MSGYQVDILDDGGYLVVVGEFGVIVVKLFLFPGMLFIFWNVDVCYQLSYLNIFPGYYEIGDVGVKDEDGYFYIMVCIDDVINVVGYCLLIGGMEEVFVEYLDVVECVVIGVVDQLKGQMLLGFLCLNVGIDWLYEEIVFEVVKLVCEKIGLVVVFKMVIVVDCLLKICLGKILCGMMVLIVDGKEWKMLVIIDDLVIFDEIIEVL